MHPLQHPRNAVFVGVLFLGIGIVYWLTQALGQGHVDFAGVTMLIALGAAMGIMAYILIAGSPRS